MKFTDLLNSNAVKAVTAASSKKRLMHDIADIAEAAYGISSQRAVEALMERESLGPTGVGHGVALPHARPRQRRARAGQDVQVLWRGQCAVGHGFHLVRFAAGPDSGISSIPDID